MASALERVMEEAEHLDPATQQAVAEQFQRIIEIFLAEPRNRHMALAEDLQKILNDFVADVQWEMLLNSPKGISAARKLARQAMADVARGDVEEGGFAE